MLEYLLLQSRYVKVIMKSTDWNKHKYMSYVQSNHHRDWKMNKILKNEKKILLRQWKEKVLKRNKMCHQKTWRQKNESIIVTVFVENLKWNKLKCWGVWHGPTMLVSGMTYHLAPEVECQKALKKTQQTHKKAEFRCTFLRNKIKKNID